MKACEQEGGPAGRLCHPHPLTPPHPPQPHPPSRTLAQQASKQCERFGSSHGSLAASAMRTQVKHKDEGSVVCEAKNDAVLDGLLLVMVRPRGTLGTWAAKGVRCCPGAAWHAGSGAAAISARQPWQRPEQLHAASRFELHVTCCASCCTLRCACLAALCQPWAGGPSYQLVKRVDSVHLARICHRSGAVRCASGRFSCTLLMSSFAQKLFWLGLLARFSRSCTAAAQRGSWSCRCSRSTTSTASRRLVA
jgi:hypothetical protein